MDNTTTHGEGERCDRFARHPNLRLSERAICFHCAHFDQPIDADGDWIIGMFRPWLDITHPKLAKHGELRWFVTAPDGSDLEVDGPEPIEVGGRKLIPMSRTFIPAALKDNPFLIATIEKPGDLFLNEFCASVSACDVC